jgi:hypothetical protein
MRTQRIGVLDIDHDGLANDLERSALLEFGDPYIEFNCGHPWRSCMVWTPGGDIGDGILAHYDATKPCRPTANGRMLPYLRQVIERYFAVEHLLFARLVIMSNNVLVPHRDYFEFSDRPAAQRAAHRIHLPLTTSDDCLFMAGNIIYRMRVGEVWALDATEIHSAAVLSDLQRVHLALDFADVADTEDLFRFDPADSHGIPESSTVTRPELSATERDAILGLAKVINKDNMLDIFGIVIKRHFRADAGADYVWDTMKSIGRMADDPQIQSWIDKFYEHCVLGQYAE